MDVESATEVRSAVHAHERTSKLHPPTIPHNNSPAIDLGFAKQRRAAGIQYASNGRPGSSTVLRGAARGPPGCGRPPISSNAASLQRKQVSQKAANSRSSSPAPAKSGPLAFFSRYKTVNLLNSCSNLLEVTKHRHAVTASQPSSSVVPMLSPLPKTKLRARPRDGAPHSHLSDAVPRRDKLASLFFLSPSSPLERAGGVKTDLLPAVANKGKHNLCTSASVAAACTRVFTKGDFSSLLHVSSSSEPVLPWPSFKIPPACSYAGCKAGTFRGRDTSDNQSCFALAHCSRCPLYPVGRVEYCSKLKEEKNYLLLMQSTLHLMQEPEQHFQYRPSTGAKRGVKSETLEEDESGSAGEEGKGTPSELDSVDWALGEGEDGNEAESSLLHVGGRAALRVRTTQRRHVPVGVPEFRRHNREPAYTEQWLNQGGAEHAVTAGDNTAQSLLENSGTLPHAGWETPDFAGEESNRWTEREVQLGEWKSQEDQEEEVGENKSVPRTGLPIAELLKFGQSKIIRARQAEMRSQLNECAISAKGVLRLLVMFAFQPMRAHMSVETARQRLGLFTATGGVVRAKESESEDHAGEEAEGGEPWTDEEAGSGEDSMPPSAFAEQGSSSDKPEGTHAHSSSLRLSPPQPPYSQNRGGRFSRSSHASHRNGDRHPNYSREPDTLPSKSSSAVVNPGAGASSDANLTSASTSLLQTQDDFTQEFDAEDDGELPIKSSPLRRFAGRLKSLFRRREKNDEMPEEPEQSREEEEEEEEGEDAGESAARKAAKPGGKVRQWRTKMFFKHIFKRKAPEQKRELWEKKKATSVLVHAPHVHLEIAVVSPAVRKCRKPLEWSGRLRLSTMLHVQYFVPVRKDQIQDQLSAFINNALRIVLRCKSKQGCVINRDLQSCVLVSCAKHKHVSREAAAASSKAAEALAGSQLKLAQSGTRGVISKEERATRATAYEKTVEEKQHEAEARWLQQHQQTLSEQEQHQIIQQQLVKFSTATPDTMQRRLLDVIGIPDLGTSPIDGPGPASMKEADEIIESSSPTSQWSRKWLTPATMAAISLGSVVGLLAVGTVCWRCC